MPAIWLHTYIPLIELPMRNRKRPLPIVPVLIILMAMVVAHRVYRTTKTTKVDTSEEIRDGNLVELQSLYLEPAGQYSREDIEANGGRIPAEKYPRFAARHSVQLMAGDRLCPITRTKANAACTWVIAGHVYEFCCPPCIDEFVRMAKENPGRIQPPDFYVHGRAGKE